MPNVDVAAVKQKKLNKSKKKKKINNELQKS